MISGLGFTHLTGRSSDHLEPWRGGGSRWWLTAETAAAFGRLAEAANEEGIGLAIASGYRDFDRQLAIWNAKAAGDRPLLDGAGRTLSGAELSPRDRMFAILRWSALPGASRHHWGTDIDVYDEWAVEPGYRVQLTPDECAPGGVFERLHRWLDARLAEGEYASFYRPFAMDRGGVAPEPWHLSYGPQARLIEGLRERHRYRDFLAGQPLALKEEVLANFDEIYERFVAPAAD